MIRSFLTFLAVFISALKGTRATRVRPGSKGLLDAHFSRRVLESLDCRLTSIELKRFYNERIAMTLDSERELFRNLRRKDQEEYNAQKLALSSGEYDQQVKAWAGKVCERSQQGDKVFIEFDPSSSFAETSQGTFDEGLLSTPDDIPPVDRYYSGSSGYKLEISGVTLIIFLLGVLVGAALMHYAKLQSSQQVVATRLRRPEL